MLIDKGGYDAVRRYAAQWAHDAGKARPDAYVPLSFDPGEAYQFDWSHEVAILGGVTTTIKVAHVRLCHSRMGYIRAYPRETQEMVFDAHDKAFAFFGGVCTRGIYDNMKTAVDAIFIGNKRVFNRRFEQMCSHYLVEPTACTPSAGWEKGQVGNQVNVMRGRVFVPPPRFKDLDELNDWLEERCLAMAKAHKHPEQRDKTIWEVFEAERASLIPYAGPFDGFRATTVSPSKTCLINFDRNRYSIDSRAAGRPVEVRAYATRIEVWHNGKIIADHARVFGRDQHVYDPLHYLPILERKPGALRNGAPFKDWTLPPSITAVRNKLAGQPDGDKQTVEILSAILDDGLEAVETACAQALKQNACKACVVINILSRKRELPPPVNIATPDALKLAVEPLADCHRYDNLRKPNHGTNRHSSSLCQTQTVRHESRL